MASERHIEHDHYEGFNYWIRRHQIALYNKIHVMQGSYSEQKAAHRVHFLRAALLHP